MKNAFLPYNRNGANFPRKINGKFAMLSRPSDDRHTELGDIFYSDSSDLEYWGRHSRVIAPISAWQIILLEIVSDSEYLTTFSGIEFWNVLVESCRFTAQYAEEHGKIIT